MLDDFTIDVRVGTPAVEILQAAGEIKPRVIVMCKHSGAERGKMLGSHGDESAPRRSLSCGAGPAGARCNTMASSPHILVPHDGTPSTSAALQPAAELAKRGRAELLVLHVADTRAAPAELGSLTTPRYVDQPQHEWPAWSSEFVKRLASACPLGDLHVRLLLAHGNTAAEILRLSEKQSTDLIVLAWRGIWEAPRAATLKDILREALCPVMVVRT